MTAKRNPLVLGIDLEGVNIDLVFSGLDLKRDRVTEIGAALWDWEMGQPVMMYSQLINEKDRIKISPELEELTGISEDMLELYAIQHDGIKEELLRFQKLVEKADYLMAHNAKGYDKPMLHALYNRFGLELPKKVWIDTFTDMELPNKFRQRSLAMLEHGHGFVNPFPHRALTDVLSMLKVAYHYPLDRMVALAESPVIKIIADLSAPNWRNRDEVEVFNKIKNKVSKARFKWNPDNKTWYKEVQKILLDEGNLNYDFDTYTVE